MRCISCGNDSKRRDRADGRCPACGHVFALDPATCGVTDLAFENAANAVTENGRLAWRPRHLYYELARWRRRRSLFARLTRRPRVGLRYDAFESMLGEWQRVHRPIPGQLPTRAFAASSVGNGAAPDVADYGFERVVLCDSDAVVDVLLANAFHIEHRCPVFSVGGYPHDGLERALPALRREPPKVVVLVHDADADGCLLAQRVADEGRWFGAGDDVVVVDAGLRPADARRFRGLFEPADTQAHDVSHLPEAERKWLAKYRIDLHVLRPRSLLFAVAAAASAPLDELAARGSGLREERSADVPIVVANEWVWWSAGDSDDDYPG